MPIHIFVGPAHVDHLRVFTIDQESGLRRRHTAAPARTAHAHGDKRTAATERHQDEKKILLNEFQAMLQKEC